MAQVFPPRPPTTFTKPPPPDTATWEAEAWEHVPCRLSTRGLAHSHSRSSRPSPKACNFQNSKTAQMSTGFALVG